MTKILPSRLKALVFTSMHVEAIPYPDGPTEDYSLHHIQYQADKHEVENKEYGYSLKISTKAQDAAATDIGIPYIFSIEAFAVFERDYEPQEGEEARMQYFADQAGYTALVGAIREALASWTARGPWGSAMLPLISVASLAGPFPAKASVEVGEKVRPAKITRTRKPTS